jgi:bud site selection protein 20
MTDFTILRDIDQIISDLRSPRHLAQHKDTKAIEDLPGLGQWYCVECAKWFEGENSLVTHRRGKNHKRRSGELDIPLYIHSASNKLLT